MKELSKSRYTAFCQCPKNLWLKVYKPEEATIDAGMEARFAQGNVVGDQAMGLLGDFKEAHAEKADGNLDLQKMMTNMRRWKKERLSLTMNRWRSWWLIGGFWTELNLKYR